MGGGLGDGASPGRYDRFQGDCANHRRQPWAMRSLPGRLRQSRAPAPGDALASDNCVHVADDAAAPWEIPPLAIQGCRSLIGSRRCEIEIAVVLTAIMSQRPIRSEIREMITANQRNSFAFRQPTVNSGYYYRFFVDPTGCSKLTEVFPANGEGTSPESRSADNLGLSP